MTTDLEQYITETVNKLPDLTPEQINRFSALMAGASK